VLRAHLRTAYMVINKTGPHYQLLRNLKIFSFKNDLLNMTLKFVLNTSREYKYSSRGLQN
jgi:hypothetical protein